MAKNSFGRHMVKNSKKPKKDVVLKEAIKIVQEALIRNWGTRTNNYSSLVIGPWSLELFDGSNLPVGDSTQDSNTIDDVIKELFR